MEIDECVAKSVLELTLEFFETYVAMDGTNTVVSLLGGDFYPRQDFERYNLPIQFEYYMAIDLPEDELLDLKSPAFCIQDPFVLNFNVSKGTSLDAYDQFKIAAYHAIKELRKMVTSTRYELNRIFVDTTSYVMCESKNKQQKQQHRAKNARMLNDLIQECQTSAMAQKRHLTTWSVTLSSEFKQMFKSYFSEVPEPVIRKGKALWAYFMKGLIHEFLRDAFLLDISLVSQRRS